MQDQDKLGGRRESSSELHPAATPLMSTFYNGEAVLETEDMIKEQVDEKREETSTVIQDDIKEFDYDDLKNPQTVNKTIDSSIQISYTVDS